MSDQAKPVPASGPMSGIRVLDLTQYILGPLATQLLGDMGADVIKVEGPAGDLNRHIGPARYPLMSAMYLGMNRNKRSIVLDLKRKEDMDCLMQLVEHADVFVHSLRPDAALKLGVGYEAIAAKKPDIVYASAPGYRSDGPMRNEPAYDDVIQGESGLADLNYLASGSYRYMPTVMVDKFCGHSLCSAITMALFYRERTGRGQVVEVPMLETMLSFNLVEHLFNGSFDEPQGPLVYDRAVMPERRPFATTDGHVCAMATSDPQWQRLFEAFDRPDLVEDPRFATLIARSANFPALYAAIGAEIGRHSTEEALRRLRRADIPHAVARKVREMPDDPYLKETGFFHHYRHPTAGPLVTPSIPTRFSDSPGQIRRAPPTLGEHTDEIVKEFGLRKTASAEARA
jgi:crotonobetainyl-CoA:carnitine CoA-transferase CaiB-like acyl-CoA transferase